MRKAPVRPGARTYPSGPGLDESPSARDSLRLETGFYLVPALAAFLAAGLGGASGSLGGAGPSR